MAEETAGLPSSPDPDLDPAERRLLAAMPLHAITSVHGQAGLRQRLLMETERFPVGLDYSILPRRPAGLGIIAG
jgi:hypothetical protein